MPLRQLIRVFSVPLALVLWVEASLSVNDPIQLQNRQVEIARIRSGQAVSANHATEPRHRNMRAAAETARTLLYLLEDLFFGAKCVRASIYACLAFNTHTAPGAMQSENSKAVNPARQPWEACFENVIVLAKACPSIFLSTAITNFFEPFTLKWNLSKRA
jgi:hypothetical protein